MGGGGRRFDPALMAPRQTFFSKPMLQNICEVCSNNCFAALRSNYNEGSNSRLVDCVSLNSRPRVIKKKKKKCATAKQVQIIRAWGQQGSGNRDSNLPLNLRLEDLLRKYTECSEQEEDLVSGGPDRPPFYWSTRSLRPQIFFFITLDACSKKVLEL